MCVLFKSNIICLGLIFGVGLKNFTFGTDLAPDNLDGVLYISKYNDKPNVVGTRWSYISKYNVRPYVVGTH